MRLGEEARKERKDSGADDSAASVGREKRTQKEGEGEGDEGGAGSFPIA